MPRRKKSSDRGTFIFIVLVLALLFLYFFNRFVSLQTYSYIIAALSILLGAVAWYLYRRKTRSYFASKQSLRQLRALSPQEFEEYIADLFRHMGYKTEVTGGSHDGGIDVIAEKNGKKYYIQCKKFITQKVSVHAVRDFYGAMADRLAEAKGLFITTNIFTLEAEQFAEDKPIELIDGQKLMEYVKRADVKDVSEQTPRVCPKCSNPLNKKTGKFGEFWGCSTYPKCDHTESTN